jgi:predicted phage terminase large subunit-like protein
MFSEQYQRFFPKTRLQDMAALEWTTTEGGMYKAAGILGGITGSGGDLIIIDDPFKDYADAHSPTMRANVWEWFWSTAYTRLSTGGAIVIIMTRWHVDDLVGRLLDPVRQQEIKDAGIHEDESWRVINLPALADPAIVHPDHLGRQEGEPLSPERIPLQALRAKRQVMGGYLWGAMFQGRPVRKGGNYCNPDNFHVINADQVPEGLLWMRYWDLATTEKQMASFTAGVAGALGPPPGQPEAEWDCLYLKDMITGQWEWPRARTRIVSTAEIEGILVGVEAVAGFKTAYQNLREELPPDVASQDFGAHKDKLTRALPWFALSEKPHQKVYLVNGDWVVGFKAQVEAFPAADFDDQVDAVSGVYNMLKNGRVVLVA